MTSADRTSTTLRHRTVLAAAFAAIGLAAATHAWADADLVDLKVMDRETGKVMPTWRHHGRLFVAGEPGARYGLRATNHTDGRVLLVISVDGVNVVTGATAKYDQGGYVLGPFGTQDVNGWRKSNTEIAAFAFAPLPQSYAAQTGRPTDVGVIGIAVFTERPPVQAQVQAPKIVAPAIRSEERRASPSPSHRPALPRRSLNMPAPPPLNIAPIERPTPPPPVAASPAPSTASALARQDEKLGTAHGERERSVVNVVTFERATPYPQSLRQIEYDTYANLVADGVIPPSPSLEHRPRPFPLNPGGVGYVPDPPPEP